MKGDGAGRMMVLGFDGVTLPEWLVGFHREHGLGGVILFARNCPDAATVANLCREVAALDGSILVMVDQEGGRVERIKDGVPRLPPAASMAALGPVGIEALAFEQCSGLRALGVHVNLAPVCDVVRAGESGAIGDRSFGADPEVVTRSAAAFHRGMARAGVAGAAKHFPGHGAAHIDTHSGSCALKLDTAELEAVDLPPFRGLIEAGVGMVMASHLTVPGVAPQPVSLSQKWIEGVLRGELGFDGVVITDDMEMAAACAGGHDEAALGAVGAGCDLLIYGQMLGRDADVERLATLIGEEFGGERIARSVARVDRLRRKLGVG